MTSSRLLLTVALACAALLPSCQTPPAPAPGTHVNWPGVPYKEVRAFCYDYTAEYRSSFWADGRMHKGVMDPKGVKLSPAQVKKLLACITVSQPAATRSNCYKPHHAFVFYDGARKIAAVFEMCFGCNRFVATPSGAPEYIDRSGLYNLTHELGLPLGIGNEFYREACRGGPDKRR